ncbi:MAG: MBL fold metallo-hydrolase [Fusobacteriaceae bacterium]|nr:MBL fold metallo-hydrolase [Fusobacteriaceae bacterium]MBN2837988.1 MBL fold metallo-hydrolase [Fusobacteriaceae bacterium]
MEIQLIRHATVLIRMKNKNILIDPMFTPKGRKKSIPTVKNGSIEKNPTVEISISPKNIIEMIKNMDMIIITHLHFDHFGETEEIKIPRSIPIICQKSDVKKLKMLGFEKIIPIEGRKNFEEIEFTQIKCNHGGILLRKIMGKASGFILKTKDEPKIYIAGDTIYCKHFKKGLDEKPDITIINAGGAKLPFGRAITMNENDIEKTCKYNKNTEVIAIHMESINHCILKRDELNNYLKKKKLISRVKIPEDGEIIKY